MEVDIEFYGQVLDAISDQIAVINRSGRIIYVNSRWMGVCHGGEVPQSDWVNTNYLDLCDDAADQGNSLAARTAQGIRQVMEGDVENFSLEYPCHSPEQQRWFSMEVFSFLLYRDLFYVIKHKDITPQRVAESRVVELARLDDLTQIGNRRSFSDFLQLEWLRCARARVPLSLMIIDIDFFKLINDNYGHHVGDRCLVKVGELLQSFCNRPSDFCARYGGDEFALVWGDTGYLDAQLMAEKLLKELRNLALPNENSPVDSIVTVSIGVATVVPGHNSDKDELTIHADDMLYQAKRNGRNRVESIEVQGG